jgi:hypothetical protein
LPGGRLDGHGGRYCDLCLRVRAKTYKSEVGNASLEGVDEAPIRFEDSDLGEFEFNGFRVVAQILNDQNFVAMTLSLKLN